ncbi:Ger(x)C family spore germination protein [Paenibacillus sp. CF384]|uniref:Ger(x)C family spore germination protein n=1 Tax=Paenibacillus sp. CF384 TaxID=1884382 RepID=UPI000896E450|nr:Ger(x)C family spore germination protein [Paenibacillus sp. CF384]SDX51869.1 germination protein, Ger(x)C family [Paenibacillus sp. CF384]
MKRTVKAIVISCILLSLCGCWDVKNIQYFNFVTVIGVDYVDGKYKIYAQINDLTTMAKTEGAGQSAKPIVIGKGEGESIGMAIFDLQKESQMRMDWTQNKAFIFSDRILARGIFDIHDELMRTRDQRYTPWVFATNEDLAAILSTMPITGSSYVATLYYQPNLLFKQLQSSFEPIQYQRFIRSTREPFQTTLIDHVKLSTNWKKGNKPFTLPIVDGLVALKQGKSEARFSREEATGVKWLRKNTKRGMLPIKDDQGTFVGTATLKSLKVKQRPAYKNGKRIVKLTINMDAGLREQQKGFTLNEMNKMLESSLYDEIMKTYEVGKKRSTDIYSFNEVWYRKGLAVNEEIPGIELDVKVKLMATGMLELRKK